MLGKLPGGCDSCHVPKNFTCIYCFTRPPLPDEAAEAQRDQGIYQGHTASWHEDWVSIRGSVLVTASLSPGGHWPALM